MARNLCRGVFQLMPALAPRGSCLWEEPAADGVTIDRRDRD